MRVNLGFVLACALSVLSSCIIARIHTKISDALDGSTPMMTDFSWVFRLVLNLLGYATVLVPLYIIYLYLDKTKYFDAVSTSNPSWVSSLLSCCYAGAETRLEGGGGAEPPGGGVRELMFCFWGLMGTYLVWGLLQEKIMTQKYIMSDGSERVFNESQSVVLMNRLSVLLLSVGQLRRRPAAPLYKFSYCSLTNVVSAWCQYEALKYVSFPTQVLSKSCKIVAVLVMSCVVSSRRPAAHEAWAALAVAGGVLMFMLGARPDHSPDHSSDTASSVMTVSGVLLLVVYLVCDSFTSSWQARLFQLYSPSPMQMMCYVSLFSCLLSAAALVRSNANWDTFTLLQNPVFLTDIVLLSLSSAAGQVLIYRTISKFGALVFTIIMTIRQALSILLSCLVYGHAVSPTGVLGLVIVFLALGFRQYCSFRLKRKKATSSEKL